MKLEEYQPIRSYAQLLVLVGVLVLAACGTFQVNITNPTSPTVPPETDTLQPTSMEIITQIVTMIPTEDQALEETRTATPVPLNDSTNDQENPSADPDGSQFWVEVQDPRTGVRFAMPCFWVADIPSGDQDPSGLGSFPIKNYTEEYAASFGPKQDSQIWEHGAIKIDMVYFKAETWGLPPGASTLEFVQGLSRGEGEGIESIEEVTINGQPALLVTTYNSVRDETHRSYNFALPNDVFLIFSVFPNQQLSHPDVQGILESLALTPDVNLKMPDFAPQEPPEGVPATCLKGFGEPRDQTDFTDPSTCQTVDGNSAAALACAIQNALLARDITSLETLMTNPFTVGYWQSEGRIGTPAEIADELDQYRLPVDTSGLTFTVERSQFPGLNGMPPENMFGPDLKVALVIYSTGWGQDGQGEALLFIAENANGDYYWHGMILAMQGF